MHYTAADKQIDVGQPIVSKKSNMRKLQRSLLQIFLYVFLSVLAFLFLMPLLWVASSSLKSPALVYAIPIKWIPSPARWHNYIDVFSLVPFAKYGLNSLIVAGGATMGAVLSSASVAYSLSRLRWSGRNLVFMMVLGIMMLPPVVTLVPTFAIMTKLHWLDTFYPLIVPSWFGANAFYIFLMRQFMLGIPIELDEAAIIDGAGSFRILMQLILPLSKPVVAAVVIFSFLERYNDLLGPAMYLTSGHKFTLAIGLYSLSGTYGNHWPYVMAASMWMTIPIIIVFVIFQRQFIQGVQMSGLAGR